MSPSILIGGQVSPEVLLANANNFDGVTWYRLLNLLGMLGPPATHVPQPPGYRAPVLRTVMVPDSRSGTGGGGESPELSVESYIQQNLQGIIGAQFTQGWTDAHVHDFIMKISTSQSARLGPFDPVDIPALADKYTAIYRTAVTPV